ncbi:hypothetical protein ACIBEA_16490 [Streptomyces sp. NPDC051555]|uniref:hypothetical protein n=1 Tax=Streptomyces sp. NPDC051555 TaxID=3365657 RepID=UPI0037BABBE7
MDVESVAVELYELRPLEFTAARDVFVAQARKAGDKQLAAAIGALRKPTVAVWAAGLLARRRRNEAHGLVQLGEALRTAHRTLDGQQLRKLSHDQHVVIGELARTARAFTGSPSRKVSRGSGILAQCGGQPQQGVPREARRSPGRTFWPPG